MKVLVVDDSATTRDRLVEILSALQGVEHVGTASRASEARHAVQAAPPDVVVLDIHMPGGSGVEVLDALRAHEPRIMTIVLTNDTAPQWRDACLRGGADFFFDKSAEFQQAIDVIARLALDRAGLHVRLPPCWTWFERLPIPAWIFDVDTLEFKAVNDAAVERYGYARAEFLAMTMTDIRRPDARPELIEHITERHSGAAIRQPGLRQHRAKDGAAIHVEITVMPLDHAGQRLDLVLAYDASERILAEAALRASENRYRELFEHATDAIFTTDLELNLTSFNSVAEALTGFRRDQTSGLRVADLVTPDSLELIQRTLADQLAGKPATMFEAAMLTRSGRQVLTEVGVRLVHREGQPFGTQGIARDITGRKQLEEQVRQSQKMASVGNLAGGIAHDFNNLLTAIAGYGELLVDRLAANPAALDDLGEIRRAVASAVDLTRQLLAFSRKQLLAPRTVSLNDVVTDLQKMLRRLIEESVQIDFALSPDLDRVYVDPGQMEQVLVNLAVNARDAMPEGGVLTIDTANVWLDDAQARAHVGMGPGPHVVLSVSDTGLGMTADVQARVFEPFFTTKPMGHGTGLGLATAHGIVHQSGGYISVDSEPGVGTTFKLYFPVASGEPLPEPARSTPVSGNLTGTETVLIVEDDARLRALDTRILQRYGYTALAAENAAGALQICTEHSGSIDVVLADVIMPGGSGRTIGDWVREHRPETRVVYMSGYTDDVIARHGVLEPGIHFLQKPFTPGTLARKIREVLS